MGSKRQPETESGQVAEPVGSLECRGEGELLATLSSGCSSRPGKACSGCHGNSSGSKAWNLELLENFPVCLHSGMEVPDLANEYKGHSDLNFK